MVEASESSDDVLELKLGNAPPADSATPVRHLFCVTLYNEPVAQLEATLSALWTSLNAARRAGLRSAFDSTICIVVDGRAAMQAEVLDWLLLRGLVDDEAARSDGKTRLFDAQAIQLDGETLRSIVIIKGRNRGKLHSHALFFGRVCARLEPELCFQLDAGTVIDEGAISAMLVRFSTRARTAALASRITSPADAPGLLGGWQYMDFASQAAVAWPAERVSGHLSVLPGQFCGLRWRAISPKRREPLRSEADFERLCSQPGVDPLSRYLHGLSGYSFGQRLMFLAEDRVIGNEIVMQSEGWRLGFCTRAHAATDACMGLHDLLRQRRRWNNGASACRLWLLARWTQRVCRHGAHGHLATAMLWQLLLLVQQLLAPALVVMSLSLLGRAIHEALQRGQWELPLAWAAGIGLGLAAGVGAAARGTRAALRDIGFTTAGITMTALLSRLLPTPALMLLLIPPAIAALLTAQAMGPQRRLVLRRACEYLFVVNPVMQVVLWAYGLARLGDLSWGTKGLTQVGSGVGQRLAGALAGALGLASWVGANALLVWWDWQADPSWFLGLDPLLGCVSLMSVTTLAMCVLHGVYQWITLGVAKPPALIEREAT